MASSSKQTGLMPQLFETSERKGPKEDVKIEMCRNLSWNRAFFTNDGLLDAEELATMTEGDGRDVKHQLQGIEEKLCRSMDSISTLGSDKTLEIKLFEKMEASTQKSSGSSKPTNSSIKGSSGEGDSKAKPSRFSPKGTKAATTQASKVTGPRRGAPISLSPLGSSTPVKTESTRSSPLGGATSGTLPANNVKSSARRSSTSSETGKATADSTSKTPPGIRSKNKVSQLLSSKLSPRTSPTNSGSSSDVNQRSSRGSSASRRSSVSNEKSPSSNARRKDEQNIGKTPSSISFKNKRPPPVNSSHPLSPLGLSKSSPSKSPASSISQQSSSSTSTVDQSLRSRDIRGTSVQNRSLNRDASAKSTLKNNPTPDQRGKQPTGRGIPSTKSGFINEGRSYKSCLLTGLPENGGTQSKNGSSNGAKATKFPSARTVAAVHTGLKSNSQKTSTSKQKQQSSGKAKSSISRVAKTLVLTSPEVMDIKGKLHALRMELSNQKQEKSKDPGGSGKSYNICINSSSYQTKPT